MDDRTKGVSDEQITGIGDEEAVGRSDRTTPHRRSTGTSKTERTRSRSEDRVRGASGVAESDEATEVRTQQIRAEIEETRDGMSETIDAIQERLRPRAIAANAANSLREAATEAVETVRNTASETIEDVADSRIVREVRANPIPAALVGVGLVGLAWLAFGRKGRSRGQRAVGTEVFDHGTSTGYYERDDHYRNAEADVASRTGDYARETGRRAQSQVQRAVTENPLFVGAAALTVGAMIGMAFPETERENELMGATRDNVVEGAQQMARDAATQVQEVATDAVNRVTEGATE